MSSPTGSRCSTTGSIVAEGTPAELKRLVPGGAHPPRVRRARCARAAAQRLADARRDPDGLVLDVPTDGGVASLRAVLDRLDGGVGRVAERHRSRRRISTTSSSPSPARTPHERWPPNDRSLVLLADSATMLRRNLLHARRYPSLTLLVAAMPVIFYLIFVYVFGSTLGNGLPGVEWRPRRLHRVRHAGDPAPGGHGRRVSRRRSPSPWTRPTGIILRFRTMSIPRAAVLAGHVVGQHAADDAQHACSSSAVAVLTGFRPNDGTDRVAGAIGTAGLRDASPSPGWRLARAGLEDRRDREQPADAAMLLPFFSSGFVPTESMPGRWLVRREPAVHADHRDAARAAARHADRLEWRSSRSAGAP